MWVGQPGEIITGEIEGQAKKGAINNNERHIERPNGPPSGMKEAPSSKKAANYEDTDSFFYPRRS